MKKSLQCSCEFVREERRREAGRKKKRLVMVALLLAVILLGVACSSVHRTSPPRTRMVFAMDTVMTLCGYGSHADAAEEALEQALHDMDRAWSRTDPASTIYQLNHVSGEAVPVEGDVAAMLSSAQVWSRSTGGAFDLTVAPLSDLWGFPTRQFRIPEEAELTQTLAHVGMEHLHLAGGAVRLDLGTGIDLGGIAKGRGAEEAWRIFAEAGVRHGFANLGGDVMLLGGRPDGSPWRVAVQDPQNPEGSRGTLALREGFVLTSGDNQRYFMEDGVRYHHILDPKTGRPARTDLHSVTVVAPLEEGNGMMCDALSTALFVLGEREAVRYWQDHRDTFDMVLVTADGRTVVTPGLRDSFTPTGDAPAEFL